MFPLDRAAAQFLRGFRARPRVPRIWRRPSNSLHSASLRSSNAGIDMAELTLESSPPRIGPLNMWKKAFFAITLSIGLGLFIFFIQKFGGFGKALDAVAAVGWPGVVAFIAL